MSAVTGGAAGDTVMRPEQPADAPAVRALLRQAFATPAEADLVDRLRDAGDLELAVVAQTTASTVVGYAAFVRLQVATDGGDVPAVGLAPLAVAATHRRRGVGHDLVDGGLRALMQRGETLVLVLGDPAYYRRFGFSTAAARPFACRYAGRHFMALRLADSAPRAGAIRYPAAFSDLG